VTEFEVEPKFKAGDIIIGKEFYWPRSAKIVESVLDNVCVYDNGTNRCNFKYLRLATPHEKQLLFDALAKAGKKWNAEKLQIEDLRVDPKVGDCVKLIRRSFNGFVFARISDIKGNSILYNARVKDDMIFNKNAEWVKYTGDDSIVKILTPSQFQSEVNALGFEYDFKNDTFKELKWEPKEGDRCFELSIFLNELCVVEIIYASRYHKKTYDEGRTFKTKSECESAIEKIKNVLKSK
jgi:hypothetical protein